MKRAGRVTEGARPVTAVTSAITAPQGLDTFDADRRRYCRSLPNFDVAVFCLPRAPAYASARHRVGSMELLLTFLNLYLRLEEQQERANLNQLRHKLSHFSLRVLHMDYDLTSIDTGWQRRYLLTTYQPRLLAY